MNDCLNPLVNLLPRYKFMEEKLFQQVAVYGFILNDNKELLIVQRALNDTMPGIWEIPGGGLEFSESIAEGIKREMKEECGIDVAVERPVFAASYASDRVAGKQVVRIVYLCKLALQEQEVKVGSDHMAYQWIDPSKLAKDLQVSDFLLKILRESDVLQM